MTKAEIFSFYLPYNVTICCTIFRFGDDYLLTGIKNKDTIVVNNEFDDKLEYYDLKLHPFEKFIEFEEIVDEMSQHQIDFVQSNDIGVSPIDFLPFNVIVKMLKNHIDVFNLIPKCEALEI